MGKAGGRRRNPNSYIHFSIIYVILFIMSEGGESSIPEQDESLKRIKEVGSLIASERDPENLHKQFNILRDTMTPAEAIQALALGIRSGDDSGMLPYSIDGAFNAISGSFGRARADSQDYVPTEADRQQVSDLFAAIQEKFDWLGSTENRRGNLSAGLHTFLNQNRELKELGKDLVEEVDRGIPERLIEQVAHVAPRTTVTEIQRMIDRGSAREVVVGIERFRFMNRVLAKLPDDRRQVVQNRLNQALSNSPETVKRIGVLGALFETNQSERLSSELRYAGATIEDLPDIFSDEAVVEIISIMADSPAEYRFQLGALFTQIPVNKLPDEIGNKIKPIVTDAELKLKSENGTWWLCGMAEPRLREAIEDRALMLVNDRLLLKLNGKLSALCLESFTTASDGYPLK